MTSRPCHVTGNHRKWKTWTPSGRGRRRAATSWSVRRRCVRDESTLRDIHATSRRTQYWPVLLSPRGTSPSSGILENREQGPSRRPCPCPSITSLHPCPRVRILLIHRPGSWLQSLEIIRRRLHGLVNERYRDVGMNLSNTVVQLSRIRTAYLLRYRCVSYLVLLPSRGTSLSSSNLED